MFKTRKIIFIDINFLSNNGLKALATMKANRLAYINKFLDKVVSMNKYSY